MEPFDLILLVVVGDLVQQGVTQSDYSLIGAALAVATLAVLTVASSYCRSGSGGCGPSSAAHRAVELAELGTGGRISFIPGRAGSPADPARVGAPGCGHRRGGADRHG
jgi:hypothetical protein